MVASVALDSAVAQALGLLSPTPIYQALFPLAKLVYHTFTPGLLLLAVYVRIVHTQLDALSGRGQWAEAVRDMLFWGTAVSAYFYAGDLIASYLNAVYGVTDQLGSVNTVTVAMARALTVATAAFDRLNPVARGLMDIVALPVRLITMLLYYMSLVLVIFVSALTSIAHAIGYSLAYVYGLFAVPISISGAINLLRGWALLYGFVVLWPIVQAMILALFNPVFAQAVAGIVQHKALLLWSQSEVYLLFTVLNLILAAAMIAAPYLAYSLIRNMPSGAPVAIMFAGGLGRSVLGIARASGGQPSWYRRESQRPRVRPLATGPHRRPRP